MGKKQGGKSGCSVQLGTSYEALGRIVGVVRVGAAAGRQRLEVRRVCGGVQPFPSRPMLASQQSFFVPEVVGTPRRRPTAQ